MENYVENTNQQRRSLVYSARHKDTNGLIILWRRCRIRCKSVINSKFPLENLLLYIICILHSMRRYYDNIIIIIIVFTYEIDLTRSPHAIHE